VKHDLVAWLYGLQDLGVKLGLDGIRGLLEAVDRPDRAFQTVLVGGTNGKGSVAAMLDAMLAAHGVPAGLYSSPHLVRPHERIRLRGTDVPDAEFRRLLATVQDACARSLLDGRLAAHPSFFEVMTASACLAFRDAGLPAAVLEVGLGGRLDATNATDPLVSAVVSVDLDHTAILGPTVEAIAREKAEIARPGRPLVAGMGDGPALAVLRETAARVGAELVVAPRVASIEDGPEGTFAIATERLLCDGLRLALQGEHQRENARTAVVAFERFAEAIGLEIDPGAVRDGLAHTRWRGRLEWLAGDPPVLLDGAHNPAGLASLLAYLDARNDPPPVLLFAAMKDKDLDAMLRPLAERARAVVTTEPRVRRAASAADLADAARAWCPRVEAVANAAEAMERARALARPSGWVLVAGSLYLVGEVLAALEGEETPGPVSM
jgi:dihydrofolate synthase/folylpolyglutamate synthase